MSQSITGQAFASAAQPVAADTLIITDVAGLVAGDISIDNPGGSIPGYRAAPAAGGKRPVVLVIQEIFGVHEHIRDVARRLAKLGYLAIAPELYHRYGDVSTLASIDDIRAVVARVPDAEVLADLDASLAWAEKNGGDASRIFATGFCWGGRITWLYAAHQPKLKAAVAWYGRLEGEPEPRRPRHPLDVLGELKAPVLGLYGGQDQGIPLTSVNKANAALKGGGVSYVHVYPSAPHAFHADYRPSYRRQDANDAWQRLLAWFKDHSG